MSYRLKCEAQNYKISRWKHPDDLGLTHGFLDITPKTRFCEKNLYFWNVCIMKDIVKRIFKKSEIGSLIFAKYYQIKFFFSFKSQIFQRALKFKI